jgi:hypothetical protein
MIKRRLINIIQILMISSFILTACGGSESDLTPTPDLNMIQTQAVETFSAALTQTALAAPSDTAVPTLTPAPTLPPLSTSTAGTPFGAQPTSSGGSSSTSCYGLTFVSDVTIPDNTQMTPGKTFTKTWKVLNSGSCAWDAGFKFAFTGGNAMGGVTLTLPSSIAAGAQYDLSVPMTAPSTAGTVQGNWRMSTASGQFFGNEVYVIIVVGSVTSTVASGAATNTSAPATATATSTPTPTPTQ